jgi:hypothetical protein
MTVPDRRVSEMFAEIRRDDEARVIEQFGSLARRWVVPNWIRVAMVAVSWWGALRTTVAHGVSARRAAPDLKTQGLLKPPDRQA